MDTDGQVLHHSTLRVMRARIAELEAHNAELVAMLRTVTSERDGLLSARDDLGASNGRLQSESALLRSALGALADDGCIAATICVYAIPGLTDHEAERLTGREGWNHALNRVASRCKAVLAKVGV